MRKILLAAALAATATGCANNDAARTAMSGDCTKIRAELAKLGEPTERNETAQAVSDAAIFVPIIGGPISLVVSAASGNLSAARSDADRAALKAGLTACDMKERYGEGGVGIATPPSPKKKK